MIGVKIDSSGFRKWLAAAASKFQVGTTTALKRGSAAAATYARISRLYKSHTYGLRLSIQSRLIDSSKARTSADAKYASYVENGTRPHEIRARRKQVLRFVQNGEVRFAKRVFHPGTHPRPYMQEARDKAEPLFERLCREAADHAFQ